MASKRVPEIDEFAMIDFFGVREFNDGEEETRYQAFKERLLRELRIEGRATEGVVYGRLVERKP